MAKSKTKEEKPAEDVPAASPEAKTPAVKKAKPKELPPELAELKAQVTKQFGEGSIMQLNESAMQDIEVISTGAMTLDFALGVGGVPRGRVVEIYGPESSGKTTLTTHIVAAAQQGGGAAAFIDTEHAFDPSYAAKIGVDLDTLLVAQPTTGEEALNIVETLVHSGALDVIVIDSVAALTPKAELEGEMGQSHVGLQARLMSQALRKLTGALNASKTCCIFTNQIREKIGVMFGSPETTPGGRALKFYSSVRMDIRRIATHKDSSGQAYGIRARVKVVKNKVAPPFREAEFDILYAEGISWEGSILDCGLAYDIVEKRGSWLSYDGTQLGQGRDAARRTLKEDKALADKLIAAIKAAKEADA